MAIFGGFAVGVWLDETTIGPDGLETTTGVAIDVAVIVLFAGVAGADDFGVSIVDEETWDVEVVFVTFDDDDFPFDPDDFGGAGGVFGFDGPDGITGIGSATTTGGTELGGVEEEGSVDVPEVDDDVLDDGVLPESVEVGVESVAPGTGSETGGADGTGAGTVKP